MRQSCKSVRKSRFLPAALLCLLALGGCDDVLRPSGPGEMTAVLKSPNGEEGAVLLELVGEGIGQVRGASGPFFVEAFGGVEGDEAPGVRAIVMHEFGGELRISFRLDDRGEIPVVQIIQVAGPDDELRGDLSAYSVEWEEGVR